MQVYHGSYIVEGPVANDNVADRIQDYLSGHISKPDFLKELSYHKPTHQICFCTLKSLQMIVAVERKHVANIKHIIRPIIEQLMAEQGMDKSAATDTIYNSRIFAQLADEATGLYKKPHMEIYRLILQELEK
ncbi:MAG: DUF3990 domain-containing protein [Prevotellaceae bacterium]|jgi:hypothetical protein|nr:DUF3990 domain-containing protein [Prevotellaceae bacterium]